MRDHSPASNRTMPACRHETADDGEHSGWHAKTSKDIPQKGSVDGIIFFGEIDKAQVQRDVLLARQFRQRLGASNVMSTVVEGWGLNPHCSSGRMFSRSQQSLRRQAKALRSKLPS